MSHATPPAPPWICLAHSLHGMRQSMKDKADALIYLEVLNYELAAPPEVIMAGPFL